MKWSGIATTMENSFYLRINAFEFVLFVMKICICVRDSDPLGRRLAGGSYLHVQGARLRFRRLVANFVKPVTPKI